MTFRWLTLVAALLGCSGGAPAVKCDSNGNACKAAGECCTTSNCETGRCCARDHQRCEDDAQCCGKSCRQGSCCVDANQPCRGDGACCGGLECTSGKCCNPAGKACSEAADCCSQSCYAPLNGGSRACR